MNLYFLFSGNNRIVFKIIVVLTIPVGAPATEPSEEFETQTKIHSNAKNK